MVIGYKYCKVLQKCGKYISDICEGQYDTLSPVHTGDYRRRIRRIGDSRRFWRQSPNSATVPFSATVAEFGAPFRRQSPNSATVVASVDRALA